MKNSKKFKYRYLLLVSLFCCVSISSFLWAEGSQVKTTNTNTISTGTAKEQIKSTIDKIITVVETTKNNSQVAERRAKILELVHQRFDFQEMAKRSLGHEWLKITPEQQVNFVKVFSDLLSRTYINKVDALKKGMVEFKEERNEGNKALVKTVVQYNNDSFPLDYKLLNKSGQWLAYDVMIENIGLVANYRNEFSGILRKESFDSLIEKLKNKNKLANSAK